MRYKGARSPRPHSSNLHLLDGCGPGGVALENVGRVDKVRYTPESSASPDHGLAAEQGANPMPATEPEQPELPLWPEPGTRHNGSAAPSPAREAGAASLTPAPADVPPAIPTATPEPPALTIGRQGGGARPQRPVPPEAEPSWWDGRA